VTVRALSHETIGDGPRSLLLLHGFLGSRRNVATLAGRLRDRDRSRSIVTLDLTGHGESPPLPRGADLRTVAGDVLETASKLGLEPRLTIVGHSLGGRAALRACLLDPARVGHVTLLDITPSAITASTETDHILDALLAAPAEASSRDEVRAHFRARGVAGGTVDWLLLNLMRDGSVYRWRIDRPALAEFHRTVVAEDLWPAVESPRAWTVHAIRGARSPYVSDTDVRRFEAAGCAVDTIDGATHWLHAERPADVAARILERLGPPARSASRGERRHG
jgi:pimeloyl-ACP methyl ester carboxylesterase